MFMSKIFAPSLQCTFGGLDNRLAHHYNCKDAKLCHMLLPQSFNDLLVLELTCLLLRPRFGLPCSQSAVPVVPQKVQSDDHKAFKAAVTSSTEASLYLHLDW